MLIGNGATVADRRDQLLFILDRFMILGSVVAIHGVVVTSLDRGGEPSVGVVCGGLGCPCGASHGTRDSLEANRPRVSETMCVS